MDYSVGNPGMLDWYTPFLAAIHEKSEKRLNILGHALVGHTPGFDTKDLDYAVASLPAQVEHALELVDAATRDYDHIVIVGHSVGSWITTQVWHLCLLICTLHLTSTGAQIQRGCYRRSNPSLPYYLPPSGYA